MKNITDQNNKIIFRIHDDGDVTKDVCNEIVGHIHPDGDITRGTGKEIIGHVSGNNSSLKFGMQSEVKKEGEFGMVAYTFGCVFVVLSLIFAIFMLPGLLVELAKTMVKEKNVEELVSLIVTLVTALGASILGNLIAGKSASFSSRLYDSYIASYIVQVIVIVFMDSLYFHDLEGFVGFMSVLIVPALIAVLPTLIVSAICMVVVAIKEG